MHPYLLEHVWHSPISFSYNTCKGLVVNIWPNSEETFCLRGRMNAETYLRGKWGLYGHLPASVLDFSSTSSFSAFSRVGMTRVNCLSTQGWHGMKQLEVDKVSLEINKTQRPKSHTFVATLFLLTRSHLGECLRGWIGSVRKDGSSVPDHADSSEGFSNHGHDEKCPNAQG